MNLDPKLLQLERNQTLAGQAVSSSIGQVFLGLTAVFGVRSGGLQLNEIIVLVALTLLNLCRVSLAKTVHTGRFFSGREWYRVYAATTLLTAVTWSLLAWTHLNEHDLQSEKGILVIVICAGIAAASTATLSPEIKLARAFTCLLAIPVILKFWFFCETTHFALGFVTTVYLGLLWMQVGLHSKSMIETRERKEQFQVLVNSSTEGIIIHQDGIISEINPALTAMFQFTPPELVGHQLLELTPDEDLELNQTFFSERTLATHFCRGQRKDGSILPIEVVSRNFLHMGQAKRVTCIRDISDRKRIESALAEGARTKQALAEEREKAAIESARLKSEFLANMSHEIRTPLNAVIGITDIVSKNSSDPEQKRHLRLLKESGESLLNLVNDILDFSRLEADKIQLENVSFRPATVVQGRAEMLAGKASEKSLVLHTYVDLELPSAVTGDCARIGQILMNLIGNAIKFTESGHVQVSATSVSKSENQVRVRFEVADSGIGISDEVGAKLFQPFSQADSSTARRYGGTGLGLSICKRLVEIMDGQIGFYRNANGGTTFWFELPLATAVSTADQKESFDQEMSIFEVRILQDGLRQHESIQKYLSAWKANVQTQAVDASNDSLLVPSTKIPIFIYSSSVPQEQITRLREKVRLLAKARFIAVENTSLYSNTGSIPEDTLVISMALRQSDLYNALLYFHPNRPAEAPLAPRPLTPVAAPREEMTTESLTLTDRILVVEDNSTNQIVIRSLLKQLGYQCQMAKNGFEAIEAICASSFDLVLMDCQMPELDGYEATRRIRRLEASSQGRLPIVALTANVFKEDREKCFECGMDDFLAKPVRREKLVEVLNKYLEPKAAAS